ncbi:MAG: hypothetical protein CMJ36_01925 [Phycisphaerae bacterium]|nr:hypothetical protein [Phycisphaerae bacterium]
MLLYAGIDEAGYGPMLGPLCIGCSVFSIEEHTPGAGAPDLWERLDHAICRGRRDHGRRIAIDDSKKLKGSSKSGPHPLHHLERGVLSFLATTDSGPDWLEGLSDERVFSKLGVTVPDHPWYEGATELPLGEDPALLRITTGRLRRAMLEAGVECRSLSCELIDADEFNQQVARTGNKASLNFEAILRIIDGIREAHPGDEVHVVVDRQGGRTGYRSDLQQAWSNHAIQVVDEGPGLCRYRLTPPGGPTWSLSFTQAGEDRHLPIALASMTAKFCRELLMLRMNTWFIEAQPGLRPTAGYVQDARRYLDDIAPVIESRSIERSKLVRNC